MESEEILNTIVQSLLEEPALTDDPEWDSVAVLSSVTPEVADVSAFRYSGTQSGKATPIRTTPLRLFRDLQEATQGPDDQSWTVCIIKIERDSARGSVNFVYGEDAEIWKITPANLRHVVENMRPQPADFMS